MDQQSGGSIEICLTSAVKKPDNFTVEINGTELEAVVKVELEAVVKVDQTEVKIDTPPSGVSNDGGEEAFKTLEDMDCVADEPKGEEDGLVESSDSSGLKSVDVGENSEVNGKLSDSSDMKSNDDVDGENSDDSDESNGYGSAEPEPESESVPVQEAGLIRADSVIDMDDPLEIARKVAIEIEKEVEGEEEEKSSGSGSGSGSGSTDGAQEPVAETETRVQEDLSKEKQSEDMILEKASEMVIEPEENLVLEPVNAATQEIEQSQIMNLLMNREMPTDDAEKSVCYFDLNEEVQVEMNNELDELNNQSSPPPPPPPAMAAGFPFQFEHGSSLSVDGSRNRENYLDFDLNSHNPPAIESPKLDLNFATDDGERQNNHVMINNGYHNFQSADRSMFDLNEHYGDNSNNKSVVSLMGVKVEVNRRDRISNSGPFFNRLNPGPPADLELTRTGGSFIDDSSSVYTSGFSPAVSMGTYGQQYNHFPYVFDSIGSALVPGFTNQNPMIGMTGLTGSNGVRPVRFNLFDSVSGSPDVTQFQQHGLLNPPMFGGISSMSGSNPVGPSSGFVFYDSMDAQIRSGLLPMMGLSTMPGSNGIGPSRFHLGSNSVVGPSCFNLGTVPSGFNSGSNGSGSSGFSFSLGSNSVVGPAGFNLGGGSNGSGSTGFNLDLNAGSFLDGNRGDNNGGGIREYYQQQQPTVNLIGGMKRGEPDSEFEPERYPFKHHRPNRE